mmetsp:Transcript_10397/g.11148  ORF Transcript_10397/g.11148 Transcript_10397/m.11148 type:complete len:81 (+) Transcript_10397:239-481(+)
MENYANVNANAKYEQAATYLAGAITAAFCLDVETSSQALDGKSDNHDPNLVYTIRSVLQNFLNSRRCYDLPDVLPGQREK